MSQTNEIVIIHLAAMLRPQTRTIATAKQSCVCTEIYIYSYENAQKLLLPELLLLAQICTKSFVGWGFTPDPIGGAYSTPPDPMGKGKEGGLGKRREGGEESRNAQIQSWQAYLCI